MKTTQTLLAVVILSTGLLSATGAYAALESRLGGLAVYDTDLNLTWLANANANGVMDWSQANAWAANITVGGVSGWRLPNADPSCGQNYYCNGSEMGHLFYDELGGVAPQAIGAVHNASYDLFQDIQSYYYWSGTEAAPGTGYAWSFVFAGGYQYVNDGRAGVPGAYSLYAMAVRPGDVAAVPVPAAAWLLGSGLLGLTGVARRRLAIR